MKKVLLICGIISICFAHTDGWYSIISSNEGELEHYITSIDRTGIEIMFSIPGFNM